MKKPRRMNIGKTSFLRHRNRWGEIIVCVNVTDESSLTLPIGISFCNPQDFNLRRDIRVNKGHGLAAKRAQQAPDVAGSFFVHLGDTVGNIGVEELPGVVEKQVIDILRRKSTSDVPFGFPKYEGIGRGDFMKWVVPFCEELTS